MFFDLLVSYMFNYDAKQQENSDVDGAFCNQKVVFCNIY